LSEPYEILSLDELERYPDWRHEGPELIPLRRKLGLRAFGANAWTAGAGKEVVPRHSEQSGDEELYVVVSGRATFSVGDETFSAPAGTLVHVEPGEERQAFADESGTIVLAVGATAGKAFEAREWDGVVVAFAAARAGRTGEARTLMHELAATRPKDWEGAYNLACFEAQFGDADAAFEHLRRARAGAEIDIREFAREDDDLEPLRSDPRWQEVVG